jgi:hypothetical protein
MLLSWALLLLLHGGPHMLPLSTLLLHWWPALLWVTFIAGALAQPSRCAAVVTSSSRHWL